MKFDSIRVGDPKDLQQASFSVSYDGGGFEDILVWESNFDETVETRADGERFYADEEQLNQTIFETIEIPMNANEMRLAWHFNLNSDGEDGWWWAIDNILVTEVPCNTLDCLEIDPCLLNPFAPGCIDIDPPDCLLNPFAPGCIVIGPPDCLLNPFAPGCNILGGGGIGPNSTQRDCSGRWLGTGASKCTSRVTGCARALGLA